MRRSSGVIWDGFRALGVAAIGGFVGIAGVFSCSCSGSSSSNKDLFLGAGEVQVPQLALAYRLEIRPSPRGDISSYH